MRVQYPKLRKHRMWVLVRTERVPTIYVLSKNKKKNQRFFLLNILIFYSLNNLYVSHGRVFVMLFIRFLIRLFVG